MNNPMSDSYKKEVEEFKKWADNLLGRCVDFIETANFQFLSVFIESYATPKYLSFKVNASSPF